MSFITSLISADALAPRAVFYKNAAHSNAGICRVNEHKPEGQSKIGHKVKVVVSNPMLEFT
jgi:hypothetical protein